MFDPAHDWPVYIFMAVFFGGIAYLIISSRINQKSEDENKPKDYENKFPKLPR